MERELWRWSMRGMRRLPPTRPRIAAYTDRQILAVYPWAVLHDRPVSWACRREHWPMQAWQRSLPDQSTMSRRARTPAFHAPPLALLMALQRTLSPGEVLAGDGKPLELGAHTRDPDARTGRGAGRFAIGYKLHLILDAASMAVRAYRVRPLNEGETTVAARMLRHTRTPFRRGCLLLGDRLFDANPLHAAAHRRGAQLIAPRQKPGRGISAGVRHHPNRFESIRMTEGADKESWDLVFKPQRASIEQFFGTLASAATGLPALPPWVRRLHRVQAWVGAKLAINAARIAIRSAIAA